MIVNIQATRAGVPYSFNAVSVDSVAAMRAQYAAQGYQIDGYFVIDSGVGSGLGAVPVTMVNAFTGQRFTVSDPAVIAQYLATGTGAIVRPDGTLASVAFPGQIYPEVGRPAAYDPYKVTIDGVPLISSAANGGVTPTNIPGGPNPVPGPAVTAAPAPGMPVPVWPWDQKPLSGETPPYVPPLNTPPAPISAGQFPVRRGVIDLDNPANNTAPPVTTTGGSDVIDRGSVARPVKKDDSLLLGLGVAIAAKIFLGL